MQHISLREGDDEASAAHTPDRLNEGTLNHGRSLGLALVRNQVGSVNATRGQLRAVSNGTGQEKNAVRGPKKGTIVRVEDASTADLMRILSARDLNRSHQLKSLLNRLLSVFPDSADARSSSSPEGVSSTSTSPALQSPPSVTSPGLHSPPSSAEEETDEVVADSNSQCCGATGSAFDMMAKDVLLGLWPAERVITGMMTCKFLRSELTKANQVKLTVRSNFHYAWSLQKDSFLQFSGRVELHAQGSGYLLPVVFQSLIQAATAGWQGLSSLDLSGQSQIGAQGTESLGHTLRFCPALRHLNLNGCQLEDQNDPDCRHSEIRQLLKELSGCTSLERLDLGYTDVEDDILQFNPRGTSLRSLNLRGSRISEAGVKHLCDSVLASAPYLHDLHLSIFDEEGIVTLAQALPAWSHLAQLGIESLAFDKGAGEALATSLSDCHALTALDISCSNLGPQQDFPVRLLHHCPTLTALDLSRNDLRKSAVEILDLASRVYGHLTELILTSTGIHREAMNATFGAIEQAQPRVEVSPEMTSLDLSGNDLRCGAALSHILGRFTQLRTVRLGCSQITCIEVKHVAVALESCHRLQELDLSWNELGDPGARHVAESLKKWSCIRELDLTSCGIGTEGASLLALAVPHCPQLARLASMGNNFTAELAWTLGFPPLR